MGPLMMLNLFLLLLSPATISAFPVAKLGRQDKCRNLSLPYPLGVGDTNCYRNPSFEDNLTYEYDTNGLYSVTAFSISDTENIFTTIGCDTWAQVYLYGSTDETGIPRAALVIDWAIDWPTNNRSCEEAMKNMTSYACGNNSVCGVSKNGFGYNCNCSQGYQGNPYLQDGCQDINECVDPNDNLCIFPSLCTNLPETFNYSCPHGF
ncbi:hypothetical protein NE237_009393 [Protea cynaroides]|uniref:EGF-like domain-containing protein n=1 Tax=Protea cynaroides TaxID=273540 RepID=A0A9Q0R093_9MAGN|nr:hypothetical protein NE237_009393 [Protea cynaroides]